MSIGLPQRFGKHIRSLREARELTQENLAERSNVSVDAVARVESGRMVPSLTTLSKLADGLDLSLASLFETFEREQRRDVVEVADYLARRTAKEVRVARRVLRAMFEER